jgi:hypothetical protein
MRRLLVTAVTVILVMGAMGAVWAVQEKNFRTHLNGGQEVPANSSIGQGQAIFKVDGDEISFKLLTANLDGITQAHIHCGEPNENGPVVVFLFGLAPPTDNNGILSQGTFDAGDFTPTSARPACADIDTVAELVEAMASGEAYVNVHTSLVPGGEIRGNLP